MVRPQSSEAHPGSMSSTASVSAAGITPAHIRVRCITPTHRHHQPSAERHQPGHSENKQASTRRYFPAELSANCDICSWRVAACTRGGHWGGPLWACDSEIRFVASWTRVRGYEVEEWGAHCRPPCLHDNAQRQHRGVIAPRGRPHAAQTRCSGESIWGGRARTDAVEVLVWSIGNEHLGAGIARLVDGQLNGGRQGSRAVWFRLLLRLLAHRNQPSLTNTERHRDHRAKLPYLGRGRVVREEGFQPLRVLALVGHMVGLHRRAPATSSRGHLCNDERRATRDSPLRLFRPKL